MAGLLGKVESFNPELEDWPQYVERLEHFFEANGLTGEDYMAKRRSTFLSAIGSFVCISSLPKLMLLCCISSCI